MGSRKGGISNESMMKLGTPIGAEPNWAMVRAGLASVGVPSGLRTGGCSIFWRWPLITSLALPFFGAFLPNSPEPGAAPAFFFVVVLPPVVVVPPRVGVGVV